MLLMNEKNSDGTEVQEWSAEDMETRWNSMAALLDGLKASGELVQNARLESADGAKSVRSDGSAPVVAEDVYAPSENLLGGYFLLDVPSEERAIEIAARTSALPGPGGTPMASEIVVRAVKH